MSNNAQGFPTGLYWQGKKTEVERISLPFQTIETINETRASREKEKKRGGLSLFEPTVHYGSQWYNRLIWGDNKYVMSSLLDEFAGKIDLIYIDPPFATGADFSVKIGVGDVEWTKEPSSIEDKAYRDTWGKGLDSYLQMMYDRMILMRELLSEKGSIYLHLDYHVGHYVKIIMDDIWGRDNFRNEIIWCYTGPSRQSKDFPDKHDVILRFSKTNNYIFNMDSIRVPYKKSSLATGKTTITGRADDEYLRELDKRGKLPEDWWPDVATIGYIHNEILGFPTQKPEGLLERIIKASTNEGDVVADYFCGSGTTGAAAEKLDRRWIMADLSRYAIHTTRKRLLEIENCQPFVVQNLGKYERQYWQGITFKKKSDEQIPIYEYVKFILELYHAEPISGATWIHGKKGKRLVHIGAVDAPVTLSDIQYCVDECKKLKQTALDILGWEWEMGLHDVVQKYAKAEGIDLLLRCIPNEVMDPRALQSDEITFYELAYLEAEVKKNKHNELIVELKDFIIPNHDLIPEEVRSMIKKWSDYIDYWSVDWDFNEDTFHNMWQTYRTRRDRTLVLKSEPHLYETKGKHKILIKVIDIFGNDTTRLLEVNT